MIASSSNIIPSQQKMQQESNSSGKISAKGEKGESKKRSIKTGTCVGSSISNWLLLLLVALFACCFTLLTFQAEQIEAVAINIYKHRYPFYGGYGGYYPFWGGYGGYGGGFGGGINIGGYGR